MSEDMGDKTEAPTPKRRAEAREQGNIARSTDLTSAALLVGTLMMLNWWGRGLVSALKALVTELLGSRSMGDPSTLQLFDLIAHSVWGVGRAMLPLLGGMVVLAVLVNVLQVGLYFNTQKLQPNLGALNPFKGLSSMFSLGRGGKGPMQMAMNLVKVTMVVFAGYSAIHARLGQILGVQYLDFGQIFGLASGLVYSIAFRIGTLLLILAILDYAWQRFRIEKELKMTKQEVKDEMRRMDGDPQIKQKRKQIQFQIAMGKMKTAVPKADVVVTNPTEFAIAIQYDPESMHAP
jgi:flagellar biosynthetic protein FlhB